MEIVWTSVGALLLAGVLALTYGVLRFRWPETYLTLSDTFGFTVSENAWRFLAFRGLPVVVATWAIAVTVERLGGNGGFATIVGVALHLWATNFRAVWRTISGKSIVNQALYHLLMIVVVVIFWSIGLGLASIAPNLVPKPEAFLEDIWLALLVALLGGSFILAADRVQRVGPQSGPDYFVWRVKRDVGYALLDHAFSRAMERGKDPFLVTAFLMAEVLQRPKWIRNAERLTSFLRRTGTYGVMQVRSKRPMSDKASIDLGVEMLADRPGVIYHGESPVFRVNNHAIWASSAKFNGDLPHIETVIEIYQHLTDHGFGKHVDAEHTIRTALYGCRLYGERVGLRGATIAHTLRVFSVEEVLLDEVILEDHTRGTGDTIRFFELTVPVSAREVQIQEDNDLERHRFEIPLDT